MIYAVDFDGTLCEEKYPDIGKPNMFLIEFLKKRRLEGHEVILYTMRENQVLKEAVDWCRKYGLEFDAVNDNLKRAQFGDNPRKVYADLYIDDHNADIRIFNVPYRSNR